MKLRISIVCPVQDTPPPLLAAAAYSVLGDPSAVIGQLILVDVASRDPATQHSLAAIAGADPRVTLLRAPRALGPAGARRLGLRAAREGWIGYLGAEEAWLPDHAARLGRLAAAHPAARWIGAGHRLASAQGVSLAAPRLDAPGVRRLGPGLLRCDGRLLTRLLLGGFHLPLGAMVLQRGLAEEVMGTDEAPAQDEADQLLAARLSLRTPLFWLDADGCRARRSDASLAPPSRAELALRLQALAARDPELRTFRGELRRARQDTLRDLARDALRAGRRREALNLALRGWSADRQGTREVLGFLREWLTGDRPRAGHGGLLALRRSG